MTDKLALSITEAGDMLGVGRTTVYELMNSGELPSVKVGRRRIIPTAALTEYFERLTAEQLGDTAPQDPA